MAYELYSEAAKVVYIFGLMKSFDFYLTEENVEQQPGRDAIGERISSMSGIHTVGA